MLLLCLGYYCVASTQAIPVTAGKPCPVGTYGARDGLSSASECSPCDAGYYCETEGNKKMFLCI